MVNVAPSDSALPALPVPEAVYRAPELEPGARSRHRAADAEGGSPGFQDVTINTSHRSPDGGGATSPLQQRPVTKTPSPHQQPKVHPLATSPLSDLVSPVSVYATPAAPTPISEGGPAETSTPIRGGAAEELSPFPAPILTPLPSSRSPAPPSLPLPPARPDNRPVSPASGAAPTLDDTVAEEVEQLRSDETGVAMGLETDRSEARLEEVDELAGEEEELELETDSDETEEPSVQQVQVQVQVHVQVQAVRDLESTLLEVENVTPSDSALPALPVPETVYRAPELEINRTARRMERSVLGTFSQAELASTPAETVKNRSRRSARNSLHQSLSETALARRKVKK